MGKKHRSKRKEELAVKPVYEISMADIRRAAGNPINFYPDIDRLSWVMPFTTTARPLRGENRKMNTERRGLIASAIAMLLAPLALAFGKSRSAPRPETLLSISGERREAGFPIAAKLKRYEPSVYGIWLPHRVVSRGYIKGSIAGVPISGLGGDWAPSTSGMLSFTHRGLAIATAKTMPGNPEVKVIGPNGEPLPLPELEAE